MSPASQVLFLCILASVAWGGSATFDVEFEGLNGAGTLLRALKNGKNCSQSYENCPDTFSVVADSSDPSCFYFCSWRGNDCRACCASARFILLALLTSRWDSAKFPASRHLLLHLASHLLHLASHHHRPAFPPLSLHPFPLHPQCPPHQQFVRRPLLLAQSVAQPLRSSESMTSATRPVR
eukprot:jgi/Botrbrau1/9426/Bobra.0252s0050.1